MHNCLFGNPSNSSSVTLSPTPPPLFSTQLRTSNMLLFVLLRSIKNLKEIFYFQRPETSKQYMYNCNTLLEISSNWVFFKKDFNLNEIFKNLGEIRFWENSTYNIYTKLHLFYLFLYKFWCWHIIHVLNCFKCSGKMILYLFDPQNVETFFFLWCGMALA